MGEMGLFAPQTREWLLPRSQLRSCFAVGGRPLVWGVYCLKVSVISRTRQASSSHRRGLPGPAPREGSQDVCGLA